VVARRRQWETHPRRWHTTVRSSLLLQQHPFREIATITNCISFLHRRYLRARKFDIAGAIGQFTDTEKWMKEQRVVELYDHFDVDFYERARLMVSAPSNSMASRPNKLTISIYSTLSGPATAINEESPSTSTRSKAWTARMLPNTRKNPSHTKTAFHTTRPSLHPQS
jgi:hypothetical protein